MPAKEVWQEGKRGEAVAVQKVFLCGYFGSAVINKQLPLLPLQH